MNKTAARIVVFIAGVIATWVSLTPSAWAVPSYTRRYNVECSRCHTMWGALNGRGVTFRMSGYRAFNGKDIKPVLEDIDVGPEAAIPTT